MNKALEALGTWTAHCGADGAGDFQRAEVGGKASYYYGS